MNIGVQDGKAKGIEWVQAEYDRLKEDINRDPSYYNVISIALSELQQEQEQVGREQKQVEHIDGFIDVVQSVFSALFPEEVYGKLLGLSEYEDKRQDFYKLIHATYAEQQKPIFEAHNAEIAAKDEKIQALTKQGLEAENQLAEERNMLQEALNRNAELLESYNMAVDDNEKTQEKLKEFREEAEKGNAAIAENCNLRKEILELQAKLEQATKPKEPVSGNLQSLIDSVKIKSTKDVPADEWIKRFEDRQANGGKVSLPLPSIGGGAIGDTFQENNHSNDAASENLSADEVSRFPDEDEGLPEIQQGTGQESGADGQSPVGTLEEAFRRIDQLEQAVFKQGAA